MSSIFRISQPTPHWVVPPFRKDDSQYKLEPLGGKDGLGVLSSQVLGFADYTPSRMTSAGSAAAGGLRRGYLTQASSVSREGLKYGGEAGRSSNRAGGGHLHGLMRCQYGEPTRLRPALPAGLLAPLRVSRANQKCQMVATINRKWMPPWGGTRSEGQYLRDRPGAPVGSPRPALPHRFKRGLPSRAAARCAAQWPGESRTGLSGRHPRAGS